MLTDLGSNCFGDANIGPLCFLSILSWILLSWVEMLLEKKSALEKGYVGPSTVCVAVAMLLVMNGFSSLLSTVLLLLPFLLAV
jgi:hypothetical protein